MNISLCDPLRCRCYIYTHDAFSVLTTAVGAILSAAAPLYPVLILGKMIYGLGIGFALHAAPAYLAEVGHPRIRGLLIRQARRSYMLRNALSCRSHVLLDST